MSDPYIDSVTLLLHGNGTNGATTFTDDSPSAQTVSVYGGAQIDTAQSKWGGASIYLDGDGDYFEVFDSTDFGFGTGPWTIEAWVRLTGPVANQNWPIARIYNTPTRTDQGWQIGVITTGKLYFSSESPSIYATGTTTMSAGVWYHVRVDYDGTNVKGYLNGSLEFTRTASFNFGSSCSILWGYYGYFAGYYKGHIDDCRVTTGVARGAELPTEEFDHSISSFAELTAASPLGAPSVLGHSLYGQLAATLLGSPSVVGLHDFTGQVDALAPVRYVMDLVTPGGLVRVPISSWQATIQTGEACYVQCVVPAFSTLVDALEEATEFVISRTATLTGGTEIEYEMARSAVQTISLASGPTNASATLSGYPAALTADPDPPGAYDRTLEGVRAIFQTGANTRARTSIDWLLRPGHRAFAGGSEMIVDFISYYVGSGDAYMDVGERG